jgi:hypothetical protein
MKIYLRTRGELRHLDYNFLGTAPTQAWWREFSGVNTMERPCLLCIRDSHGLRVFLGGVPSSRVDTVSTLIVYSLVLEDVNQAKESAGEKEPAASDAELTQRLITAWVQAIRSHGVDHLLSDALDEAFPLEFVETSLTARGEDAVAAAAETEQRLRSVLAKLPPVNLAGEATPEYTGDAAEPGKAAEGTELARWIAGIGQPAARAAFLARTQAIIAGEDGQAHVLNMVADGTQVPDLLPAPRIALLMEGEFVGDPMAPITELPQQAAPKEQPAMSVPGELSNTATKAAVKVLAVIVVAGILAWVIYRVTGAGKLMADEPLEQ